MRRVLRDERGFTFVLTLVALLVLTLTAAAVLTATAVNHRSSLRSAEAEKAFALAQQGLAYAEGRLYTSPQTASSVLVPGTTISPADDVGSIHYSGTLCTQATTPSCDPKVWTLYGTGTVDGISRTVSAQVTIPTVTQTYTTPQTVTTQDPSIWSYVYVDSSTGCTTLSGQAGLNVPFYTHGSLCLGGQGSFTGSDLEVGGSLTLSGQASVGSSNAPISRMNVGGACTPAPCDGAHSPIWVNAPGVGRTLTPPDLTKPPVDLAASYASANPGPLHPCPAGSNVPANFFDNDGTLNASDGTIDLFPSGRPYDCKAGSNELAWDGAGNLTVNGAFYFDGNLVLSGETHVVYSGKGTLAFTGTISLSGQSSLCGVANCASTWNPDANVLVLVAGCQNGSGGLVTGYCVTLSGQNTLQTGTYSVTDYNAGGQAVNMGPVIMTGAPTFSGQAGQLIPIRTPPPGAPVNTTTTTITTTTTTTTDGAPSAPGNWSG